MDKEQARKDEKLLYKFGAEMQEFGLKLMASRHQRIHDYPRLETLPAPNGYFFAMYYFNGKWENCGYFADSVNSYNDQLDLLEAAFRYYGFEKCIEKIGPSVALLEAYEAENDAAGDETSEEEDARDDAFYARMLELEPDLDFDESVILKSIREHASEYFVDIREVERSLIAAGWKLYPFAD